MVKFGDKLEWFQQLKHENPEKHIIALDERPILYDDLIPYWTAFNILSSSRTSGFSMGFIPYSEIKAYCDENGLIGEDRDDFFKWIRFIDRHYVSLQKEK